MDKDFVKNRINQLCKDRGLSYYKLCAICHINKSSISALVNGKRTLTIGTLTKICNGLGITLAQFFSQAEDSCELTEEQKNFLTLWNKLDDENKRITMSYMQGMNDKITLDKKNKE